MSARVISWMADAFRARTGVDLRDDANAMLRIREEADRVAKLLRFHDEVVAFVPGLAFGEDLRPIDLRMKIQRREVAAPPSTDGAQ